jgi:hypothetical protein
MNLPVLWAVIAFILSAFKIIRLPLASHQSKMVGWLQTINGPDGNPVRHPLLKIHHPHPPGYP